MALADQIRTRRTAQGLSKAELARRAKITRGHLGQLEGPDRRCSPSAGVLYRIAFALGTSFGELLEKTLEQASGKAEVTIPEELRLLALEEDLPEAEIVMLARIWYRGQQPATRRDWWFLHESIKRACGVVDVQ